MSVLRALLAAVLVTVLCVGLGLVVAGPGGSTQPPPQETLANVTTSRMDVVRRPFCSAIDPAAVATALKGAPASETAYGPGQNAEVTAGVTDVADEYSCGWKGANGAEARAWLFASAVTTDQSSTLAGQLPPGCSATALPTSLPPRPRPFGSVSSYAVCTSTGQGPTELVRGLFGSSWLSCQLTGTPSESENAVLRRALRWCLVVARAA